MSTLYRRPGSYALSWYCAPGCPTHPQGKTQHCISLRTKDGKKAHAIQKEHDRNLETNKARAALGLQIPTMPTAGWSLQAFIDHYELRVLKEQLVSVNSWNRTERWALQTLLTFRPDALLADLDEGWVMDYQSAMKRRVAPATWNSRRGVLRAVFNRALRWHWIPANPFPALDRAKARRTTPKRLHQEQLPLVLEACTRRFWQLVTLFLYSTGCRLHELCDLTREAIRWHQGYLEIVTNKENQPKLLALTPSLKLIMTEAQTLSASTHVFSLNGGRLHEEAVKSYYDRLSRRVKFRVSPHRFRHSHGTHVMDAGGNLKSIQSTLGHADIRTTAQFYLDVDFDAQRRSMELLPVESLLSIATKSSGIVARKSKGLKT